MLIIDFTATRALICERCVVPAKIARKYGFNPTSFSMFLRGKFFGRSGHGVYGRMEKALIDMDLLVYTVAEDEKVAA